MMVSILVGAKLVPELLQAYFSIRFWEANSMKNQNQNKKISIQENGIEYI